MQEIMSIKELSNFLNLSISNIRKMVRGRKIPFLRIGNRIYFNTNSIQKWLEELEEKEKPIGLIY
jgi:DNA binding domain, excisionase family